MEAVFGYIIGLGAAVMMPIIFTILGVCIKIKFGKALQSGLYVGVGFVGLSVITALLTTSLSPSLSKVVEIYGLNLEVFDMGWPAAAAVAYNTSVGAFIIPVCLGVNILMLLTKTTKTVNIDLWNYWHFAFIGAMVYYTMDSIAWGFNVGLMWTPLDNLRFGLSYRSRINHNADGDFTITNAQYNGNPMPSGFDGSTTGVLVFMSYFQRIAPFSSCRS